MLALLTFGVLGVHFLFMRKAAKRPWGLLLDRKYTPRVSVIVPTYNECDVIEFKLRNLAKLEYPRNLLQLVFVDSDSTDGTVNKIRSFAERNSSVDVKILVEKERRGKSVALNFALKYCDGDVIAISDADCFWPSELLYRALPFLADSVVGAVSGPKMLLNPGDSWVTKNENAYLNSMNLMKLGESKIGSTLLFEGGFSAYRKGSIESFDPHHTGSDDCGTIMSLVERNYRAIHVPEARFYSAFPTSGSGKVAIKTRRANQLVRVFLSYLVILFRGGIKISKRTIVPNVVVYLLCPSFFMLFLITTPIVFFYHPYLLLLLLVLFIPRVRSYLFETFQAFLILFIAQLQVASKRSFLTWQRPADRTLLTEELLGKYGLI